jgi:hypothetical protein
MGSGPCGRENLEVLDALQQRIHSLEQAQPDAAGREFLSLKEEFLDLYAAMELIRRNAEAEGRFPPEGPVKKAHDALRHGLQLLNEAVSLEKENP